MVTGTRKSDEAMGRSDAFVAFQQQLSQVAGVDRPVLIIGERGTGKELAATRLHYLSRRWGEPLVTLNCAAMAPTLIASELFGHEAGAFTGATRRRAGRFEAADRGTLFLDEIGNIPIEAQEKILRVVEYGRFERVGATAETHVDVRVIGATNADLPALADQGRIKRDLLDRLSFEVLFVPPLRARQGDILFLANHFAARMSLELDRPEAPLFSDSARARLEEYPWPGNIRELKNVVERAVYTSQGDTIDRIEFDPFRSPFASLQSDTSEAFRSTATSRETPGARSLPDAVRLLQISMLSDALSRSGFHQRKAAEILGLSYHQFRGLFRKYRDSLPVTGQGHEAPDKG